METLDSFREYLKKTLEGDEESARSFAKYFFELPFETRELLVREHKGLASIMNRYKEEMLGKERMLQEGEDYFKKVALGE